MHMFSIFSAFLWTFSPDWVNVILAFHNQIWKEIKALQSIPTPPSNSKTFNPGFKLIWVSLLQPEAFAVSVDFENWSVQSLGTDPWKDEMIELLQIGWAHYAI